MTGADGQIPLQMVECCGLDISPTFFENQNSLPQLWLIINIVRVFIHFYNRKIDICCLFNGVVCSKKLYGKLNLVKQIFYAAFTNISASPHFTFVSNTFCGPIFHYLEIRLVELASQAVLNQRQIISSRDVRTLA